MSPTGLPTIIERESELRHVAHVGAQGEGKGRGGWGSGFLDAPSHLIRGRVRPSVRPSVGLSRVIFEGEKYAY